MKLRTVLSIDGIYTAPFGDDDDMCNDAVAAHAYKAELANMRAGVASPKTRASELVLDLLNVLDRRVDDQMRAWGFEPEAGK